MVLINKTGGPRFTSIAGKMLESGQKSANGDLSGFKKTLRNVVESCGNSFLIRLDDEERNLLARLKSLDEAGTSFKCRRPVYKDPMKDLIAAESAEKAARIASIEAALAKEKAIMDETTYASRRDIDDAKRASSMLKGEVEAKKLQGDVGVSLKDIMGDNRFIEESMKHSKVRTSVASEEGWDMNKMNAPKTDEAPAAEAPADEAPADPDKKSRKRRGSK